MSSVMAAVMSKSTTPPASAITKAPGVRFQPPVILPPEEMLMLPLDATEPLLMTPPLSTFAHAPSMTVVSFIVPWTEAEPPPLSVV